MKGMQTWKINFEDGTCRYDYCKKSEILDNITAREFFKIVSVEMINKGDDKVSHRPLTREQLI